MKNNPVLVLDLGGGSIKLGLSTQKKPLLTDNAIYKAKSVSSRVFIGPEIENCPNLSSLFCTLPFKKGYLNSWDTQKQILDSVFKQFLNSKSESLEGYNLICTEPYFNFESAKESMNEVFFEEYEVSSLLRCNPAFLSTYKYQRDGMKRHSRYTMIIDSGYSFTHVIPMLDGEPMSEFIMRIPIGGKIMTNRLIEMISFRQLDVRSETYIMNQCKEAASFVSTDFATDMRIAHESKPDKNPIMKEYVLPDYMDIHRGFLRDPLVGSKASQDKNQGYTLNLTNERFTIPELIFHPSDIGFVEMGLAEGLDYLMNEKLPKPSQFGLWANCVVTGGNACIPNFDERCYMDMRKSAPDDFPVNVLKPENPQTYAWEGGCLLSKHHEKYGQLLVSRSEYYENGSTICEERFPVC